MSDTRNQLEAAIQSSLESRRLIERRQVERRAADTVSHKLLAELVEFLNAAGYGDEAARILNKYK
jgi:hypothetical protein